MTASPIDDLPAILRRESVYCALGRLSRALASFGGIDFNAFLQHASSWLGQGVPLYVYIFYSYSIDARVLTLVIEYSSADSPG